MENQKITTMLTMLIMITYNMKGVYTSVDYMCAEIEELKPDIILLQETWHLSNANGHLATVHKGYTYIEQSGVDSQALIITGRPKGGLAILFKNSLADCIHKLETNSNRVCAARGTDILIINAYYAL